ncbi:MAG: bifunctional folylpolyglutamate synthase/dihydrofolate synthase, partial [Oscillospiraceae bacterium]|nr:bifunctional folylpolyglutamate synthase/dihydrofolate synthase [Oscillospiraceae bacterium]
EAEKKNSPVIIPDKDGIKTVSEGFMQSVMEYKGLRIKQAFVGIHQSYNAAVVIETAKQLKKVGFDISDRDIVNGIESTEFPARIEVISRKPLVILDGGHNVDGVTALKKVLETNRVKNLTAVWASLSDKEPEKIIDMMSPYIDTLYTVPLFGARALTSQQLAVIAEKYVEKVYPEQTVEKAIDDAFDKITGGLLVFGSLYLAADARKYLIEKINK